MPMEAIYPATAYVLFVDNVNGLCLSTLLNFVPKAMWAPCGREINAQIPSVRDVQFGRPARSQASLRHFYPGTPQHGWIVAANHVTKVEKCGFVAISQSLR